MARAIQRYLQDVCVTVCACVCVCGSSVCCDWGFGEGLG